MYVALHMNAYFTPRPAEAPASFALGCMNFGKRTPPDEAARIVARAVEAGVGLLDTANMYGEGESERILGGILKELKAPVRVASKVGLLRRKGRVEGLSEARVVEACDESLQRLSRERIDLYYLHAPDPNTPAESTLRGLSRLLDAGKIGAWGMSNFASWQILEWTLLAREVGLPRPSVAQQLYNPLVRQLDIEYFAFARRQGLHTTVYNPLAGGLLSGQHQAGAEVPKGSRFDGNPLYQRRYWTRTMHTGAELLAGLAREAGHSLPALVYAFLARQPGVDSILIGPGSLAHLDEALAAREIALDGQLRRRIDAVHVELQGTDARYAR